jgi:hypothetical protein
MALQCGTTSDGCQGKVGTYLIDYTIPDAGCVRYLYPNETWKEVKGATRYTTEINNISPTPGQGNGVRYRISVYTQANLRISDSKGDRFEGTYYPYYGATNEFIGPITSIVIRRTDSFGGTTRYIGLRVVHAGGTATFGSLPIYTGPNGSGTLKSLPANSYWQLPELPPDYPLLNLRVTRKDGLPEDTSGNTECIFKVFNEQNAVLFESTREVCPDAIVVPSTYGETKGSFKIGNRDPTKPLKVVNNSTANNIKSTSILLGNTVVKKIDAPVGSTLFPRVCWDCTEDEKCPENTCSVDCGDRTCCYNSLGISVKEIRK